MDATSILFLLPIIGLLETSDCPSYEEMRPCECAASSFIYIHCPNILRAEDLIPSMKALESYKTKVLRVKITDSSLLYIPDNLFKNIHIEHVETEDTNIMSLSEAHTTFNGLEEVLRVLTVKKTDFLSLWNFEQIRNLKNLRTIQFHRTRLESIIHPLPQLPKLGILELNGAELSYVADDAFSNLPKLDMFEMQDNAITVMKRSMFSNPANDLSMINLSGNMLSYLPNDFFVNMPSLTHVYLDKNKFQTLSEICFSVALQKIVLLSMEDNPFHCDCRMKWLVKSRLPARFEDTTSFFFILSLVGLYQASICPSEEDINPCICGETANYREVSEHRIDCAKILNPEQLVAPMMALQRNKNILYLYIRDSSLLYLPANIFKNTHIKKVRFSFSEIMSLSETDTAFSGLEEVLTSIQAMDVKFASHWDFQQLRNLKALRQIGLNTVFLRAVDHPFPHLPELSDLSIVSSEISYIIDGAFSYIPKLTEFYMADNKLTEMKRSMFSNPANSLHTIDLSKNTLSYLPDDFFENMPKLYRVFLNQNKFITLSQKLFSVIFRKIGVLSMPDNPFRCDCRLHWLVNHRLSAFFKGQCSSPKTLSGRDIVTLDFKRLWC